MTPEQVAEVLGRLDERTAAHGQTLSNIEAQATKTNGRVTAIEKWKERMVGAWITCSLAGPLITGLLVKYA